MPELCLHWVKDFSTSHAYEEPESAQGVGKGHSRNNQRDIPCSCIFPKTLMQDKLYFPESHRSFTSWWEVVSNSSFCFACAHGFCLIKLFLYQFTALDLIGKGLSFSMAAHTALGFALVTTAPLVSQQCLENCWAVLAQHQGCLVNSPARASGTGLDKKCWEDIYETTELYERDIPYHMTSHSPKKNWGSVKRS